MTTLERKEPLQAPYEATKSLHGKGFPCNLQHNNLNGKDVLKRKDAVKGHSSREIVRANGSSNEIQKPSGESYKKLLNRPEFSTRTLSAYPYFQKVQAPLVSAFDSQFCPFVGNWPAGVPVVPVGYSYAYPYEAQFQEFQYFVVIDFEATCDKDQIPHPQEIIEFPSVIVNSMTGELEDCFQTYVRPTHNKQLTDFCKDLTGIHQTQVDKGVTLREALSMHDKWLEQRGITNFAVVTWSNWDCSTMLNSECRIKNIDKPLYFNHWINLRVPFHQAFGNVRCNLKGAVELAGLVWQGREHCGLDDAKNTARLLSLIMQMGYKLSITNSLMWESADYSVPKKQPPDNMYSPPTYYTPLPERTCFCGAQSTMQIFREPGPWQNRGFFICGRYSPTHGAVCPYYRWASPAP